MPAIRKIRIVNFRFNDGAKLIPDEIFCTENSDGNPVDTLFALENGGGKSVLVQLMMQPVCPKAKVQNRNISEYFQKGTDHAFVLIEWALDNSSNSLLTGIAMAASTNANDETESKNIRYYTFLHNYARTGDKLDLINLPLTEHTDNHIRAMSFDELRKYLLNKKVEYFHSDSLHRYQKRLEEYGILHTEWENILVRINSVEGGITKFFEEYKTADKLLDRFIIPGILPSDRTSSDDLEKMFLNYAESYTKQEENMKLRSQISVFTEKLKKMLPLIKDMWNAEDTKIQAIRLMKNQLFTLEEHIRNNTERKNLLETKINELKENLRHIMAEKVSEEYYRASDDMNRLKEKLTYTEQQKETVRNRHEDYAHRIDVLNAAKEYNALTELQNKESALYAQLRELEHGNPDTRICSLKYSLFLAAKNRKSSNNAEYQRQSETKIRLNDELRIITEGLSELQKKYSAQTETYNKATGSKDILLRQINERLNELDMHISVMLDGMYNAEDIEKNRLELNEQLTHIKESLSDYETEELNLENELTAQEEKRRKLVQRQAEIKIDLNQFRKDMSEYKVAYDAAKRVLEHLSVSEERMFTDEPLSCINRIIREYNDKLKKAEYSSELISEQLRCIKTGQLHISGTAVSFLQETGISFQTGEYYLLHQPQEVRNAIFTVNPLTAYAVIVNSSKEQEKLLSLTADTWLSSVVPVYTLSEIADMAEKKWNKKIQFLCAYDSEYFSDISAYEKNISRKYSDTQKETENIKVQIEEWEKESNTLLNFHYSADYEQQILEKISYCDSEYTETANALSKLNIRWNEIRSRKSELKKLQDEQQKKYNNLKQNISEYSKLCYIIKQYETIYTEIVGYEIKCRQLANQINEVITEQEQIKRRIRECEINLDKIMECLNEYQQIIDELQNVPEADLLSEEYDILLNEYQLYKGQHSSDMQKIQEELKNLNDKIRQAKKELERFGVPQDEYKTAEYSVAAYQYAKQQHKQSADDFNQISEQYMELSKEQINIENRIKQSECNLEELHIELLERTEISSDYDRRSNECKNLLRTAKSDYEDCEQILKDYIFNKKNAEKYADKFRNEMAEYSPMLLDNIADTEEIRDHIDECIDRLKRAEKEAENYLNRELEPFRNENSFFIITLDGIRNVTGSNQISGDKYYTLYERIENDIERYVIHTKQLDIDLKDVDDSRMQALTTCLNHAKRLYDKLNLLARKSSTQIGNTKKQMIRIELPEIAPTSNMPSERINDYITEQLKIYLSEQHNPQKNRKEHLEIRCLLNCYIGRDSIPVIVYKIDKNIQNSRYRSWEDALKANSGGEQFVVLFSLIVSMMNYTRSLTESLSNSSGVLILDNPFGPISSAHLLEPMFNIAHHFHIQLICLTHLGTAEVTNCFDMVYQLKFRNLPLSNVEILEAKQNMEHAFYLSEQLSLF